MSLSDKRYIYLAGKIKKGHGATVYRTYAAPKLRKYGLHSLDPLRGKWSMQSWASLSPNEVVVRDLQDIDRAHVVLAVMMKCEDSSFGTPCEVMYAWLQRVPVVMITDEPYLAGHFWPRALCAHIIVVTDAKPFVVALDEAIDHIGQWYGSGIEEEIYNNPELEIEKSHGAQNAAEIPNPNAGKQTPLAVCPNCEDSDCECTERLFPLCDCPGRRRSETINCPRCGRPYEQ